MTRPEYESRSTGPLANTLSRYFVFSSSDGDGRSFSLRHWNGLFSLSSYVNILPSTAPSNTFKAIRYIHSASRHSWCNGYRRRKWTRRHEFKSWTRLFAFHITLIHLGKLWIQLFSFQLWVNSRADWYLTLTWQPVLGKENSEFKPVKIRLKLTLCRILRRGWEYIYSLYFYCFWLRNNDQ